MQTRIKSLSICLGLGLLWAPLSFADAALDYNCKFFHYVNSVGVGTATVSLHAEPGEYPNSQVVALGDYRAVAMITGGENGVRGIGSRIWKARSDRGPETSSYTYEPVNTFINYLRTEGPDSFSFDCKRG